MLEQPLILIVDDEADFREIFSTKLKSVGYHIETAENGQQAIEKAKVLKPALVLMDVNMPVMDGASALLKLRDDPETKDINVAFLTSLGDPRSEMKDLNVKFSENFGAKGYLKKTENLDVLVEQIAHLLT
jgi:CheY-like chemotaxis protein